MLGNNAKTRILETLWYNDCKKINPRIKVYHVKQINLLFDAIFLFIAIHIANLEIGV
jgi:hypothetical protein